MNEYSGGYQNYVTNSDCYKKLEDGKAIIKSIINKLDGLINTINDANGAIFENMEKDLLQLKKTFQMIDSHIEVVKGGLITNAKLLDVVLDNWQKKVGKIEESSMNMDDAQKMSLSDQSFADGLYYVKIKSVQATSNGIEVVREIHDISPGSFISEGRVYEQKEYLDLK